MKTQHTWLPRSWVQPLLANRDELIAKEIGDKLIGSQKPIRIKGPQPLLYLPKRHWLIDLGRIEKDVRLSDIPEKLKVMNQTAADGVWHLVWDDVLLQLIEDGYLEGNGFWARNREKYFQCDSTGAASPVKEDGNYVFVPVYVLNKNQSFLDLYAQKNWEIDPGEALAADIEKYMQARLAEPERSLTLSGNTAQSVYRFLLSLDHWQANLPILEPSWLTDANRGLWEIAWRQSPLDSQRYIEVHFDPPVEGRDPALDIRKGVVAIDFGTSTTVVAVRENGKTELLRVGVSDLLSAPEITDYQNPTVIEFINYAKMMQPWSEEAHRPLVSWQDVRVSHAAQNALRQQESSQWKIVVSTLPRLKQLPLSHYQRGALRLVDQVNYQEFEIPPLQERWPVRGEPVYVRSEDPFDPIELYAYHLGLAINHRTRGIFLRYFMTFPVNYPREAKQLIRASFTRGLLRSLPATLTVSPRLAEFKVQELATEPAAYAISALQKLRTSIDSEEIAYGVFDFGGGTTDFDFGVYRMANESEEKQGYETVLEHCGASGDIFLGGENLIEQLAYRVFQQNLELCREQGIQFTKPHDGEAFPGSEWLLADSWYAKTNMTILMTALRPMWESQTLDFPDQIDVNLVNSEGKAIDVRLAIKAEPLVTFLRVRLTIGVESYFVALKTAFSNYNVTPKTVHILLAGNASNSTMLQEIFGEYIAASKQDGEPSLSEPAARLHQLLHGWCMPEFQLHPPLPDTPDKPFLATGKTGVALGLLSLIPGEPVLVRHPSANGQAPFRYFVGKYVRQVFTPVLSQNGQYNVWKPLGVAPGGAVILVFASSPIVLAEPLSRGNPNLREIFVEFQGDVSRDTIFIRAIDPDTIEVAAAPSIADLEEGKQINSQTFTLEM